MGSLLVLHESAFDSVSSSLVCFQEFQLLIVDGTASSLSNIGYTV